MEFHLRGHSRVSEQRPRRVRKQISARPRRFWRLVKSRIPSSDRPRHRIGHFVWDGSWWFSPRLIATTCPPATDSSTTKRAGAVSGAGLDIGVYELWKTAERREPQAQLRLSRTGAAPPTRGPWHPLQRPPPDAVQWVRPTSPNPAPSCPEPRQQLSSPKATQWPRPTPTYPAPSSPKHWRGRPPWKATQCRRPATRRQAPWSPEPPLQLPPLKATRWLRRLPPRPTLDP